MLTAMGHLNERFAGRSQQDAHEFLAELLDQISEKIRELTSDKASKASSESWSGFC